MGLQFKESLSVITIHGFMHPILFSCHIRPLKNESLPNDEKKIRRNVKKIPLDYLDRVGIWKLWFIPHFSFILQHFRTIQKKS